ncbi:hypothetical protein [Streptomyces sp.]|nr:hypothetical protein [Streptomyces sp.]HET6354165.1 hypothetical protein [Streptomyces sp.]
MRTSGTRALRTVLAHPPSGMRAVLTYRPEGWPVLGWCWVRR